MISANNLFRLSSKDSLSLPEISPSISNAYLPSLKVAFTFMNGLGPSLQFKSTSGTAKGRDLACLLEASSTGELEATGLEPLTVLERIKSEVIDWP